MAPIFLLRFSRTQRARLTLPILALVHYLATLVSMRGGLIPGETLLIYAVGGAFGVLPYVADTALARRVPGWARTLIFPATAVVLDWAFGLTSLGTLGSIAYSQFGFLPFTQMAAITGIWGMVFLIMWLAPVANEIWEHGFSWATARSSVVPLTAVLLLALLLGSVRLAFFQPTVPTVRVAALSADRALWDSDQHGPAVDDLLARTRREAQAGAKIVSWAEAAAFVRKEDEAALIRRAETLAREQHIYLQLGLIVELSTERYPFAENRAILIDPSGHVVQSYFKTIHPLGDADIFAPGPGVVPTTETPYGRLATVICFDADFPALVRQAGQARADILLVPSNDWQPVDEIHARAATFRSVENGVAMVRPTGNGISVAVDHLGQPLATADYFTAPALTMVADVPTRGVATIYSRIGDAVAYVCIALLVILCAATLITSRLRRRPDSSGLTRAATPRNSSTCGRGAQWQQPR